MDRRRHSVGSMPECRSGDTGKCGLAAQIPHVSTLLTQHRNGSQPKRKKPKTTTISLQKIMPYETKILPISDIIQNPRAKKLHDGNSSSGSKARANKTNDPQNKTMIQIVQLQNSMLLLPLVSHSREASQQRRQPHQGSI